MYKIYSRNRLKIFKPRNNKKNISKFIYTIIIMTIAVLIYTIIYRSIDPIFENICEDEAKAIATKITNDETTKAIENYTYNDMFTIERDELRKYTNDKRKCNYNR